MINPGVDEVTYNGIDDDCDSSTPDDDLDGDGYLLADDCNVEDANINPGETETPYNGIDDDCDPLTVDDDLDQDGFLMVDDCDDDNADIKPDATEVTYNGIDDDCNPITLDDDLDEDGFVIADDCDDTDPLINPDAIDIPNNDIDEDCDGQDAVSGVNDLNGIEITVGPNPAQDFISVSFDSDTQGQITVYSIDGTEVYQSLINSTDMQIDVSRFTSGLYLLKITNEENGSLIERIVVD